MGRAWNRARTATASSTTTGTARRSFWGPSCRSAPALPGEDTCRPCGDAAIEHARVGVDAWLRMHAARVLELERGEREQGSALRVVSEATDRAK